MLNEPVRILADWLNDTTAGATGVNDVLALSDFPKDGADSLPSNPTYYDGSRHAFAARGVWPRESQGVTFPCVVTRLLDQTYSAEPRASSTGGWELPGSVTLQVMIVQRLQDTDEGAEDVGYLVRAVINSLGEFNKAANTNARERNGYRLRDCTSQRVQPLVIEHEDNLIASAIVLTYDTDEVLSRTT